MCESKTQRIPEPRKVQRYTDAAIERADLMTKEDYKLIKHMNKIELSHYLAQVYARGHSDGYREAFEKAKQAQAEKEEADARA